MLLWESKMCRLAWQLLGMLGNVLGRPRHALQCPRHALQRLRHAWQRPRRPWHVFLQGPRSPTSKIKPPTCFLINCEAKGVVYHQASINCKDQIWLESRVGTDLSPNSPNDKFIECGRES